MKCRRRQVLAALCASVGGAAGCGERAQSSATTADTTSTGSGSDSTTTGSATPTVTNSSGSVGSWSMIEFDAGNTNQHASASGLDTRPSRNWRIPFGSRDSNAIVPAPLLSAGRFFAADGTGTVFPVDARTGENRAGLSRRPQRPLATADDTIYCWAIDRERETQLLVALDFQGAVEWETAIPVRRAVVVGDSLYVTVHDDEQPMSGVVAIDRPTGDVRWRQTVSRTEPTYVAATADRVFECRGQVLTSRAAVTGNRRWEFELPTNGSLRFGRPRLAGDAVVVQGVGAATAGPMPRLWALPQAGPPVRWNWEGETSLSGSVAPVVTGSHVVGIDKALTLADGSQQWSNSEFVTDLLNSEYGEQQVWDAAASGSTLFLGTGDTTGMGEIPGAVAAVALETGETRWQMTVDGGVRHLVVGDGRLFVVTLTGAIEAYG